MKFNTYISDFVSSHGPEYLFGISGIPNLPLFEELYKKVQVVQNVHESHCVYSSMGGYLHHGKVPFVIVTAGPGVTNCMTPLAEAYLNDIPVFLISINNTSKYYGLGEKHDSSTTHYGADTVGITKKYTCFSAMGLSPENTSYLISEAYKHCLVHKKPVHVSIPKDFLESDIPVEKVSFPFDASDISTPKYNLGENFPGLEGKSNCLIVISDIQALNDDVKQVLDEKNIFVCDTMQTFGSCQGISGYIGCFEYIQPVSVEKVLKIVDTIVFLGGDLKKHFIEKIETIKEKEIIHFSNSPLDALSIPLKKYNFLVGSLQEDTHKLISSLPVSQYSTEQIQKIIDASDKHYATKYKNSISYHFFKNFNQVVPEDSSLFISVGGVNNYANLFLKTQQNTQSFFPSYFLNMGQSMKGIGHAFFHTSAPNFILIGDGNFYMNGMDILTAVEHHLNINVIVFNNRGYASLTAFYTNNNHEDRLEGLNEYKTGLDFQTFAQSAGCGYYKLDDIDSIHEQLKNIDFGDGVNIIEVCTEFTEIMPT